MKDKENGSWKDLKEAFRIYVKLRDGFVKKPSAVSFVQRAFSVPEERAMAIDLVLSYPESERVVFFRQLISMSSYVNGFTEECRNLILELPRDWVMKNIEAEVDGVLVNGGYEEYRCLLELCCELDRGLMIKFAKRALDSSDEDIKDAGADFLSR
ncbi:MULTISPECIES: hypothetical protein [Burkholderia]|uniref:hypothetical protein n=1 Tax=Burkholderia TaxID=32008 RepID=UPI000F599D03|nr:hypothetical protein [Burkholderia cepacia]MCA7939692.1 hypothetical protein [Burkholderia cepacia]MCA8058939.1 hypothetical protein [Burkholderia cepacia]MCA8135157.1 hypothetical protein [Burkholderia cepacia]MCA8161132.1 hypothetical protein [Burkholderia cepacia]MDN7614821.1 hypothetical protein [Burkholderia cepacia]